MTIALNHSTYLGMAKQATGRRRDRPLRLLSRYLKILSEGTEPLRASRQSARRSCVSPLGNAHIRFNLHSVTLRHIPGGFAQVESVVQAVYFHSFESWVGDLLTSTRGFDEPQALTERLFYRT